MKNRVTDDDMMAMTTPDLVQNVLRKLYTILLLQRGDRDRLGDTGIQDSIFCYQRSQS